MKIFSFSSSSSFISLLIRDSLCLGGKVVNLLLIVSENISPNVFDKNSLFEFTVPTAIWFLFRVNNSFLNILPPIFPSYISYILLLINSLIFSKIIRLHFLLILSSENLSCSLWDLSSFFFFRNSSFSAIILFLYEKNYLLKTI